MKVLRDSAKKHKAKSELFACIAQHLVPDETYRLTESDLLKLEMLSQYL